MKAMGTALRHLVGALSLAIGAVAGAQTAPAASAASSAFTDQPCDEVWFEPQPIPVAPVGAPIPSQGVVVRIVLEYQDVDGLPSAAVIFNSGGTAFAEATLRAASAQRIRCARPGPGPIRFMQEVRFVGGDAPKVDPGRVIGIRTSPAAKDCLRSADGGPLPPWDEMWGGMQTGSNVNKQAFSERARGIVIIKLTFRSPDLAPETKVLFRRGDARLENSALEYVANHRWTCMKAGDRPFEASQTFRFLGYGETEPTPNKGTLQQFLGIVDKLAEQKVRFDFTTMGCPFVVRFNYTQPFQPNGVVEIGGRDLNRNEFVAWLSRVNVKPALNPDNKLVDRDFEVSVPCLVLDLT